MPMHRAIVAILVLASAALVTSSPSSASECLDVCRCTSACATPCTIDGLPSNCRKYGLCVTLCRSAGSASGIQSSLPVTSAMAAMGAMGLATPEVIFPAFLQPIAGVAGACAPSNGATD